MIRVPVVNEGYLWKSGVAKPYCVLLQVIAQESFFAALFCRIRLAPRVKPSNWNVDHQDRKVVQARSDNEEFG
ncbi:hypothetical protein AVEN_36016-1 [Araneus ventricosus]|uniref:Uncharacterized protein n=1 Tax=Araneus ventricosus TaxID=182803 RepID=A0A4Y2KIG7_ARAVE|nr:hypothetical protein AVEN_36016-1 [Araneus ventricosus]